MAALRGRILSLLATAPIPGTKRVAQLEQNAAADDLELTVDQLARLAAIEPPVGDRYADMTTVNR